MVYSPLDKSFGMPFHSLDQRCTTCGLR